MRTLSTTYKQSGLVYELVKRDGDVAMFRAKFADHWEVVIVQKASKDYTWPTGHVTHAGDERLPGNDQWGKQAWTCSTEDRAELRYQNAVSASQRGFIQ